MQLISYVGRSSEVHFLWKLQDFNMYHGSYFSKYYHLTKSINITMREKLSKKMSGVLNKPERRHCEAH